MKNAGLMEAQTGIKIIPPKKEMQKSKMAV